MSLHVSRKVHGHAGAGLRVIGSKLRKSTGAAATTALLAALVSISNPVHAADETDFARTKKCMNCHALDQKVVGPAFKAIGARYANDPQAEARLARKIRIGGAGAWGVVPMPANDVTQAEAGRLAHWVLEQK